MSEIDGETRKLISEFEGDREVSFWGKKYVIRPRVVTKPLGDGRQVIGLTTTDARPAYWIIRVDSRWQIDNHAPTGELLFDHVDEVYDAIEEEFGCAECGYCGARYGSVMFVGRDDAGEPIWESAGCEECRDEPEEEGEFPHFCVADGVGWWLIRYLDEEALAAATAERGDR